MERAVQPPVLTMRACAKTWVISGALLGVGWITGCSASTDDPQEPPPSGNLLPSEPGPQPGGGTATNGAQTTTSATQSTTVQQCIAACEAKYPNGAKLGKAIDTCWAKSCAACLDMADAPLEGPTSGSCKTEVATPSAACSTCTAKNCCSAWDACFSDADCTALNTCSVACYK